MTCLLAVSLACLFDPSQVYVTGELVMPPFSGYANEYAWCGSQGRRCAGPVGVLKLGMHAELQTEAGAWTLDYGVRHQSYVMEDDRGKESVYVSVTWRPLQ